MGSGGSGSFSDYSGRQKQPSGNGGSSGGDSGEDQCRKAFNASLEDVASYDFFINNGAVPSRGTEITIILATRVIAVDMHGVTIGALPTSLNYLAACLSSGFTYSGIVRSSSNGSNPRVDADFVAI